MKFLLYGAVFLVGFVFTLGYSQDLQSGKLDINQNLGQVEAIMYAGITYDILHDPTRVSFEYPQACLSFNVPIKLEMPDIGWKDQLKLDDSVSFVPRLGAQQRLNYSFRIDVPMFKGVFSYGSSHNVSLSYSILLGNSSIEMVDQTLAGGAGEDVTVKGTLRGYINVPVYYTMGWQTQTFGYAFQPMRDLTVGINLHQHIFEMKGAGNISASILGHIGVNAFGKKEGINIDYGNEHVYGTMDGEYKLSTLTPTLGVKWKRFGYTARFGINRLAQGHFKAKYAVPFFVDPQTFSTDSLTRVFETDSGQSAMAIIDKAMKFKNEVEANKTDSISYYSTEPLKFNIPSGHTFNVNILKSSKLSLSYTKVVGARRGEIAGYHEYEGHEVLGIVTDSLGNQRTVRRLKGKGVNDLDFGFAIDHVIVLAGRFKSFRFNVGTFTMDFRERTNKNLIGGINGWPHLGSDAIFPILGMTTLMGNTTKVLLELDLLPIPSIKTGLLYYF